MGTSLEEIKLQNIDKENEMKALNMMQGLMKKIPHDSEDFNCLCNGSLDELVKLAEKYEVEIDF